ncbi:MAG: hypothetical protein OSB00_19855 [Sphingomonas bacterium]|nr:hypothetical protein [Sphingomonas bacterium]
MPMPVHFLPLRSVIARSTSGLIAIAVPAAAIAAPRTTLVQCGAESCLRVTGKRAHIGVRVIIAGQMIPVKGGRSWRATLPLALARSATNARGDRLMITQIDPHTNGEVVKSVAVPPGAMGKRIALTTLEVHAY